MGLFNSLKANKAIDVLVSGQHPSSIEFKEAFRDLKEAGPSVIDKLIDAFDESYPNPAIDTLLLNQLDNKTLKKYIDALTDDSKRVVAGVTNVMSQSNRYDPNKLFDLLTDPDIPKAALLKILHAQRKQLDRKNLLKQLDKSDRNTQQLVFHILNDIADHSMQTDLINALKHEDQYVRQQLAMLLGRFDNERSRNVLLERLQDSSKAVRLAALTSLGKLSVAISARPITQMLRDPDFNVQSKAIETLSHINDPNIVKYLIEMLQDDSEDIRRAAVEVLNNVGSEAAITDLFNALRDKDWWVRSRAADALATIGGDNVINAVLGLIKSDDEFLRRSAVEIMNKLKDDRAVNHLLEALKDSDWWVRERAADALADMEEQRALPLMLEVLQNYPDSSPGMIQAIARLGGQEAVKPLLAALQNNQVKNKKAILRALESLISSHNIDDIEAALTIISNTGDQETQDVANQTMQTLITRRNEPGSMPQPSSMGASSPSAAGPTQVASENQYIDPEILEPGSILATRYKVIRQVGKGAFGVVILVEDQMVHEQIILKFLNPHMASDDSVIQRFVHEMRYTRRITHPNVIRIYDFLTFGKSYAISMEYFDSHSLAQEIKQKKNRDFKRNLKLLVDVCKGLTIAHNLKIVHRDIKPANILINDSDVVKIVDFGLASAVSQSDARLTKSGILVGTPTYMAPEQVRGRKIDIRTDIYSLGIVMYELFTGKPPYKDKDHMATLFQHVEGKARPPSELNPVVSENLDQVIMRAISVDPEKRYQHIEQLQHDIEKLLQEAAA